jgi:hypothetical protein
LLDEGKTERWRKTLEAVDRMRDKYGDSTVSLAAGLKAGFHARVHENPENLPGKDPKKRSEPVKNRQTTKSPAPQDKQSGRKA